MEEINTPPPMFITGNKAPRPKGKMHISINKLTDAHVKVDETDRVSPRLGMKRKFMDSHCDGVTGESDDSDCNSEKDE